MRKNARHTRIVSSRALARSTAALLDEIQSDGVALVIVRYDRPAALVIPYHEGVETPLLPRIAEIAASSRHEPSERSEADDAALDALDLNETTLTVFREIAAPGERHWRLGDSDLPVRQQSIAASSLELDGLVERGAGSIYRLTLLGERLAERLLHS